MKKRVLSLALSFALCVGLLAGLTTQAKADSAAVGKVTTISAGSFHAAAIKVTERGPAFLDTTDPNVEKMAALGVVNGVGDAKFDPNTKLTRELAATMLARLADAIRKPIPAYQTTFADDDSISSWAKAAVGQMQQSGVMNGVGDNRFSPAGGYTREQSIVTMLRLLGYVGS